MHMRIDAMKVAARSQTFLLLLAFWLCETTVLTASNCRETASLFANYTSSKGFSMETVDLDPPLTWVTPASNFSLSPIKDNIRPWGESLD